MTRYQRRRAGHSTFVIGHSEFREAEGFTIIELIVVIGIVLVLAGLILATSSYVHNKGARSRAEAEIAAISAALENYKADNGAYPISSATSSLNAQSSFNPSGYQSASIFVGSSRVDLQACKLEYSIVSPK